MARKKPLPAKPPAAASRDVAAPGISRLARALPLLVIAAAFVHSAIESWRKLGSLLIDTGRELELPHRLLDGAVLYADVRYYWGPLAPYWNALLYKLFGVSIDTLAWSGLASAALMCAGLYVLGRHFLPRWAAAGVAVAFIYLGAFAHLPVVPIFNFVLPFNSSATWGIVVAVFSVHLLLVHLRTGAVAPFLASALLLALTALLKVEVVLATGAAHAAFLLTTGRRLRRVHVGGWLLAAVVPTVVYGAFYARVGAALWRENLGALVNPASRHYVQLTMGLADPKASLLAVGGSALALTLTVLAAFFVGRTSSRLAVGALGAAVFAGYAWLNPDLPQRALPLVLAFGLARAAVRWHRRRREDGGGQPEVVLWAFCLACVARIWLRATPSHYGFYLLPPCLVCLVLLLVEDLPGLVQRTEARRRAFAVTAGAMLLGMSAAAYGVSHAWHTAQRLTLSTPRGTLMMMPRAKEPALVKMLASFPPGTTAVAIPQGVGLIFAAGLSSADPQFSYLPMEFLDSGADERLRARWEAKPPRVIVWWRTDLRATFGVEGFGLDYATQTGKWVEAHYRPVTEPASEFVVLVFRE